MELLCIDHDHTFKKVVDAVPELAHKLPGEKKAKYLTSVIEKLLKPGLAAVMDRRNKDRNSSRCATEGEEKKVDRRELRVESKKAPPKSHASKKRAS